MISEKRANGRYRALLQTLGLKKSHLVYITIAVASTLILILVFIAHRKRNTRLTIHKICNDINNSSLLEMTSSRTSSNETPQNMTHWDDIYGDFIDFNLANVMDEPLPRNSLESIYSNSVNNEYFSCAHMNMEDISLEKDTDLSNGN